MSTHINCQYCGTADIWPLINTTTTTVTTDVGQFVMIEEPVDPSVHLAPNHQDYVPNHRKQRRGKHKRSGRG